MWRLFLTHTAEKQLRKLPSQDADKISNVLNDIRNNPFGGDVVKLGGMADVWRRRVGNYRIIFELSLKQKAIFIYDIKRRTSKTY